MFEFIFNNALFFREVSYIMRYLLQFPSEAQVRDNIIDRLDSDEPSDFIKFNKFEPFMLEALMNNEFEPSPAEHLLAAFKVFDPESTGRVRMDVLTELLTTKGIPLRTKEIESFINFAGDKTGEWVYYEDYVQKMVEENERHKEFLLKDYDTFKPKGAS